VLLASKGITISPFKDSFRFIGQGYLNKALSIAFGAVLIVGYLLLTISQRNRRKNTT